MKFYYGIRKRTTIPGYREWYDGGSCRWCGRTVGPFEIVWSPGNDYSGQISQHLFVLFMIGTCIWHWPFIFVWGIGAVIAMAIP